MRLQDLRRPMFHLLSIECFVLSTYLNHSIPRPFNTRELSDLQYQLSVLRYYVVYCMETQTD